MYGHVMSPKKFSYLFVYVYGFKRKIVRVTRFVFGTGMVENIFILQNDILNRYPFQNGNLCYGIGKYTNEYIFISYET